MSNNIVSNISLACEFLTNLVITILKRKYDNTETNNATKNRSIIITSHHQCP